MGPHQEPERGLNLPDARKTRIVVTGRSGQLASSLIECAAGRADIDLVALGRPGFDLADLARVAPEIERLEPDVVVNTAAYTAVDRAEDEREAARTVNALAAGAVAEGASRAGAPVIHLSTDYVFDGRSGAPYPEDHPVAPLNVYGRTKCEGERLVAAANPAHFVLRTAWVFSPFGSNFVRTMLRIADERGEVSVVDDQHGNPTSAKALAAAVLVVADRVSAASIRPEPGIYHLAGAGEATWFDLASEVFAIRRALTGKATAINPISYRDFPARAARPIDSRLDCSRFSAAFGHELPHWRDELVSCVERLVTSE